MAPARTAATKLRTPTCRGCNAEFETNNANRVYCCGLCGALSNAARSGLCFICGQSSPARWTAHSGDPVLQEFWVEHLPCRRDALDDYGRPPSPPRQRKKATRKGSYRKHRDVVLERDGLVCAICRVPTDPDAHNQEDRYPTLDHITPVSWGGTDDLDNLRIVHRWCNLYRSSAFGFADDDFARAAWDHFGETPP
jgi:hypothetical protein